MNHVSSFNMFGVCATQITCLCGNGAPTTATDATVGSLYMNTNNGDIYKCVGVNDGVYQWQLIDDVLFVTLDYGTDTASKTAAEIYRQAATVGPVMLNVTQRDNSIITYPLTKSTADYAVFSVVDNNQNLEYYVINNEGSIIHNSCTLASQDYVDSIAATRPYVFLILEVDAGNGNTQLLPMTLWDELMYVRETGRMIACKVVPESDDGNPAYAEHYNLMRDYSQCDGYLEFASGPDENGTLKVCRVYYDNTATLTTLKIPDDGTSNAATNKTGAGVPTTATEGSVGQLYMDTDTGALYKCTAVAAGVYTWVKIEEGGGSAEGAVLYTEQELAGEQKQQARQNIGAADEYFISKMGIAHGAFTVAANTNHSSTLDRLTIDIPQGETYYITCTSSLTSGGGSVFEVGADGNHIGNGAFVVNTTVALIASKDIKQIGFYVGTMTADTDFEFLVYTESSPLNTNKYIADKNLRAFAGFNNDENPQRYGYGYNVHWNVSIGALNPTTGAEITAKDRMISDFIAILKPAYFEYSPGVRVRVFKYSLDGAFISAEAWTGSVPVKGYLPSGYKYRFLICSAGWQLPTIDLIEQNMKIYCDSKDDYASKDFLSPEVWDTATKAEAEQELSFSFALVTDAHISHVEGYHNWGDTKLSLANVNSIYPLDAIFSLGDAIEGNRPAAESKEILKRMRNDLLGISANSFMLHGNHDTNDYYDKTNHTERLTCAERYALCGRYANTKVVRNSNSSYGFYDVDSLKIRVVMLDIVDDDARYGNVMADLGYSTEQVEWVRDVALDTEYQVIFLSHQCVTTEFNYNTAAPLNGVELRNVIEAFIAAGGVVVGMFHGHTHWDFIGRHSDTNGFYEISTGTANRKKTDTSTPPSGGIVQARTAGTVTQELWDLVIVKPLSRTVKMIRFGAGDDREFSY